MEFFIISPAFISTIIHHQLHKDNDSIIFEISNSLVLFFFDLKKVQVNWINGWINKFMFFEVIIWFLSIFEVFVDRKLWFVDSMQTFFEISNFSIFSLKEYYLITPSNHHLFISNKWILESGTLEWSFVVWFKISFHWVELDTSINQRNIYLKTPPNFKLKNTWWTNTNILSVYCTRLPTIYNLTLD